MILIELPAFWLVIVMAMCVAAGWVSGREWERKRVLDVEESPDNMADGEWSIHDEPGAAGIVVCVSGNPNWSAEVHDGARIQSVSGQGTQMVCPNCGITWREMP